MFPSMHCCNFHPCVLDFFPLFIIQVSAGPRDLCPVFGRMQDTSGFQILVWPWRSQKGRRSMEELERWATWVRDLPPSSPRTPGLRMQRTDRVEGPGVVLACCGVAWWYLRSVPAPTLPYRLGQSQDRTVASSLSSLASHTRPEGNQVIPKAS